MCFNNLKSQPSLEIKMPLQNKYVGMAQIAGQSISLKAYINYPQLWYLSKMVTVPNYGMFHNV